MGKIIFHYNKRKYGIDSSEIGRVIDGTVQYYKLNRNLSSEKRRLALVGLAYISSSVNGSVISDDVDLFDICSRLGTVEQKQLLNPSLEAISYYLNSGRKF